MDDFEDLDFDLIEDVVPVKRVFNENDKALSKESSSPFRDLKKPRFSPPKMKNLDKNRLFPGPAGELNLPDLNNSNNADFKALYRWESPIFDRSEEEISRDELRIGFEGGISIKSVLEDSKIKKIEKISGVIRRVEISTMHQTGLLRIADSSGEIDVILHRKNFNILLEIFIFIFC
jgi:hypothetical protein